MSALSNPFYDPPPPPAPQLVTSSLSALFSWQIPGKSLLVPSLHHGYAVVSQKFALLDYVATLQLGLTLHDDNEPKPKEKLYHVFARLNVKPNCQIDLPVRFRISVREMQNVIARQFVPSLPQSAEANLLGEAFKFPTERPKRAEVSRIQEWMKTVKDDAKNFVEGYQSFAFKFNRNRRETARYPLILYESVVEKTSEHARFLYKQKFITIDCEVVMEMRLPNTRLFELDVAPGCSSERPKRFIGDRTCDWVIHAGNEAKRILIHEDMIPSEWDIYKNPETKLVSLEHFDFRDVLALLRFNYYNLAPADSRSELSELARKLCSTVLHSRLNEVRALRVFKDRVQAVERMIYYSNEVKFTDILFCGDSELDAKNFYAMVRGGRSTNERNLVNLRNALVTNFFVQNYIPGLHYEYITPSHYVVGELRQSSTEPESSSSVSSGHRSSELLSSLSSAKSNTAPPPSPNAASSDKNVRAGSGSPLNLAPPNVTIGDPATKKRDMSTSPIPSISMPLMRIQSPRTRSHSDSTNRSVSSMEMDSYPSGPIEDYDEKLAKMPEMPEPAEDVQLAPPENLPSVVAPETVTPPPSGATRETEV